MKIIVYIIIYARKVIDRIYMCMCRSSFSSIGKNVIFHPTNSHFSYKTISIGNNVGIGDRALFIATLSHIYIYIIISLLRLTLPLEEIITDMIL